MACRAWGIVPSLASVPRVDLFYLQDKLTLELVADEQGSLPPNAGVLTMSLCCSEDNPMVQRTLPSVRLTTPPVLACITLGHDNVDIQIAESWMRRVGSCSEVQ